MCIASPAFLLLMTERQLTFLACKPERQYGRPTVKRRRLNDSIVGQMASQHIAAVLQVTSAKARQS